jgi:hypothetical protein
LTIGKLERRSIRQQREFEEVEARVQAVHADLTILKLKVSLAIEAADAKVAESKAKVEKALAVEKEAQNNAHWFRELATEDEASMQLEGGAGPRRICKGPLTNKKVSFSIWYINLAIWAVILVQDYIHALVSINQAGLSIKLAWSNQDEVSC